MFLKQVHFEITDKSSIEDYDKEEYKAELEESISNEEDSNDSANIDSEL